VALTRCCRAFPLRRPFLPLLRGRPISGRRDDAAPAVWGAAQRSSDATAESGVLSQGPSPSFASPVRRSRRPFFQNHELGECTTAAWEECRPALPSPPSRHRPQLDSVRSVKCVKSVGSVEQSTLPIPRLGPIVAYSSCTLTLRPSVVAPGHSHARTHSAEIAAAEGFFRRALCGASPSACVRAARIGIAGHSVQIAPGTRTVQTSFILDAAQSSTHRF
jgi:hypothetical protein